MKSHWPAYWLIVPSWWISAAVRCRVTVGLNCEPQRGLCATTWCPLPPPLPCFELTERGWEWLAEWRKQFLTVAKMHISAIKVWRSITASTWGHLCSMFLWSSASLPTAMSSGLLGCLTTDLAASFWLWSQRAPSGEAEDRSFCSW